MIETLWLSFVVLGFLALVFATGAFIARRRAEAASDARVQAMRRLMHADEATVRRLAFTRAAQAVGIWPHRVTRRADLVRHLLSLGDAPPIGAVLPPDDQDEHPVWVERSPRVRPGPADLPPVLPDDADAGQSVVDAYRAEGVL